MSLVRIQSILRSLKLKGQISKDIVEVLHDLAGYSKRKDLLESELRKLGHSAAGVHQNIKRMLDLGLLEIRNGTGGIRLALTKDIWGQEVKIVDAVSRVAQVAGKDRRSNTKVATIVREVKTRISKRIGKSGTHKFYVSVIRCALLSLAEWKLVDGHIVHKNIPEKQLQLPVNKPSPDARLKISEAELSTGSDSEVHLAIPDGIELVRYDMESIGSRLKKELSEIGIRVQCADSICIFEAKLSLGRRQRVYVTVRLNALMEKVFWLYTLSGKLSKSQKALAQILLEHNNGCSSVRVTTLKIKGELYLACCATVSAASGWEKELPQTACLLSNLGDQLEERYWKHDKF